MKTYKELKDIAENFGVTYTPNGGRESKSVQDTTTSLNDLGNEETMGAITAFIKQFTESECMNPRQRVAQLRTRLNTLGLHFDFDPAGNFTEGTESYSLSQFGGSFGTTPEHDLMTQGFKEDDGITPKLGHGLALEVSYNKADSGLYKLEARIVKTEDTE